MNHTVKGTITQIGAIQAFDSGAKKINFVIDTGENFNNTYSFDLFKSGEHVKFVDDFDKYNKVGDVVEVEFVVNCREHQGKHYTNLGMWRITKVAAASTKQVDDTNEQLEDDLPF